MHNVIFSVLTRFLFNTFLLLLFFFKIPSDNFINQGMQSEAEEFLEFLSEDLKERKEQLIEIINSDENHLRALIGRIFPPPSYFFLSCLLFPSVFLSFVLFKLIF